MVERAAPAGSERIHSATRRSAPENSGRLPRTRASKLSPVAPSRESNSARGATGDTPLEALGMATFQESFLSVLVGKTSYQRRSLSRGRATRLHICSASDTILNRSRTGGGPHCPHGSGLALRRRAFVRGSRHARSCGRR